MPIITLPAHVDGEHIVLDEPFELPANTPLIVTVLPTGLTEERTLEVVSEYAEPGPVPSHTLPELLIDWKDVFEGV